jgi:hypothetical protein
MSIYEESKDKVDTLVAWWAKIIIQKLDIIKKLS